MSEITKRAMLVSVRTTGWQASKLDKRITQEVAQQHNLRGRSGRYTKILMISEKLDKLNKLMGQFRNDVLYPLTLPWLQDGTRIMHRSMLQSFIEKKDAAETKLEAAKQDFLLDYDSLVWEQRYRLNGLWSLEDYPTGAAMERKFTIDVDFMPFPEASDFRVDLDYAEVQRKQAQIEESIQAGLDIATKDAWKRLYREVEHMGDKLRKDGKLYESIVDNVRAVADVLPRLNVAGDAALDSMARECRDRLGSKDIHELRDSPRAKQQTIQEVDTILANMEGYL